MEHQLSQGEDEEIRQLPTVVDGQTKKQSVDRSIRMETARLDRSCGKNKIILGREDLRKPKPVILDGEEYRKPITEYKKP